MTERDIEKLVKELHGLDSSDCNRRRKQAAAALLGSGHSKAIDAVVKTVGYRICLYRAHREDDLDVHEEFYFLDDMIAKHQPLPVKVLLEHLASPKQNHWTFGGKWPDYDSLPDGVTRVRIGKILAAAGWKPSSVGGRVNLALLTGRPDEVVAEGKAALPFLATGFADKRPDVFRTALNALEGLRSVLSAKDRLALVKKGLLNQREFDCLKAVIEELDPVDPVDRKLLRSALSFSHLRGFAGTRLGFWNPYGVCDHPDPEDRVDVLLLNERLEDLVREGPRVIPLLEARRARWGLPVELVLAALGDTKKREELTRKYLPDLGLNDEYKTALRALRALNQPVLVVEFLSFLLLTKKARPEGRWISEELLETLRSVGALAETERFLAQQLANSEIEVAKRRTALDDLSKHWWGSPERLLELVAPLVQSHEPEVRERMPIVLRHACTKASHKQPFLDALYPLLVDPVPQVVEFAVYAVSKMDPGNPTSRKQLDRALGVALKQNDRKLASIISFDLEEFR